MPDINNTTVNLPASDDQLCFPFIATTIRNGLREFIPGYNNELTHMLRALITRKWNGFLYLWGAPGTGKTHLLRAVCLEAAAYRARCAYLCTAANTTDIDSLSSNYDIICLDGVDQLAPRDEKSLLFLYERLRTDGGSLLVSARQNIQTLPLQLNDLRSRLQWGLNYRLKPLNDHDRLLALQQRVRSHALSVPDNVLCYLIEHTSRDTYSLFSSLETLIQEAGRHNKPLTTHFIRQRLADSYRRP